MLADFGFVLKSKQLKGLPFEPRVSEKFATGGLKKTAHQGYHPGLTTTSGYGHPKLTSAKHCHPKLAVAFGCRHPEKFLSQFKGAGTDYFAFHFEAVEDPPYFASLVREKGMKPVVALRPETPQEELSDDLLSLVDMILILAVKPGFAGQKFDERVLPKIGLLAERLKTVNPECLIEVDGNINETTIPEVVKQGAKVLVGGTSGLFRKDRSIEQSVKIMRNSALRILKRGSCL